MTLTATLSGQTEREPFNAEKYFANPDQYDVEYRNGEKPLRVIHVPEADPGSEVLTVKRGSLITHYKNGLFYNDTEEANNKDLFMRRRTDPAESLRGKWVVVDLEGEACAKDYTDAKTYIEGKRFPGNYAIIHLK